MNVIFIWDLSLHSKGFFFQLVSESQSFQTTVGEWKKKSFWEIDAAGQSDLCETVHRPSGSKGVAHVVFLLIDLLHFPLLPTSLLCPSERERCRPHWCNCPESTCLLSFAMAEAAHPTAHGAISFPEVTRRNSERMLGAPVSRQPSAFQEAGRGWSSSGCSSWTETSQPIAASISLHLAKHLR